MPCMSCFNHATRNVILQHCCVSRVTFLQLWTIGSEFVRWYQTFTAFDTTDHSVLLLRLKSIIGITGKALDWLTSYLTRRKQSILINGSKSRLWDLLIGVLQGSVHSIHHLHYPTRNDLKFSGVGYHFYNDDSQIYISFDIDETDVAVAKTQDVIKIIKNWMLKFFLYLNESAHMKVNILL